MADEDAPPAVVVDAGSGSTKAGLSGEDAPHVIFPSIVGKLKTPQAGQKDNLVGDDTQTTRDMLNIHYPIERGLVTNWDDMEAIWHHAYKHLQVEPSNQNILLTELPGNGKENREKTAQIMFEKFQVPGLHLSTQSILSLFASGRQSGLVLDSGDGVTKIVPVYEGFQVRTDLPLMEVAGSDITRYLVDMLAKRDIHISMDDAKQMKEKVCYILKGNGENPATPQREYKTAGGKVVQLNEEQHQCTEALFNPNVIGMKTAGLPQLILEYINKCDMNTRKDLYRNIVVCGGTTTLNGFVERLREELAKVFPDHMQGFRIHAPHDRKYSAWLGGSLVSSFPTFKEKWITKKEYDENGPSIVEKRLS